MHYITLQINGQFVDLGQEENIPITYSVNDIKEPGSREGAGSKQFRLPATRRNRKILGWSDALPVSIDRSAILQSPAILRVGEAIVLEGAAVIEGHEVTGDLGYYTLSLYGDNAGWWRSIEGKLLTDLYTPELEHMYSISNIKNSWHHTWEDGYVYPLIDYGVLKANNYTYSTPGLATRDWLPAVFIKYLVSRIVKEAGYSLGGSFFNDPLHSSLIIPFSNSKFEHTQAWVDKFAARLRLTSTHNKTGNMGDDEFIHWNSIIGNTSGWATPLAITGGFHSFTFTAPEKLYVSLGFLGKQYNARISLYLNNAQYGAQFTSGIELISGVWGLFLNAGDTVQFKFQSNDTGLSSYISALDLFVAVAPGMLYDAPVERDAWLPYGLLQTDLIQALYKMFNLYIYTDEQTRTVHFDKAEDFILTADPDNAGAYADWSGRLDISKSIDTSFNVNPYGQRNTFTLADAQDDNIESYNKANPDLPYGHGMVQIKDTRLEEEVEAATVDFAPTWMHMIFDNGLHVPFIDLAEVDGSNLVYKGNEPGLRILLYAGLQDANMMTEGKVPYLTYDSDNAEIPYAYYWKKDYPAPPGLALYDQNLYFDKPQLQELYGKGLADTYFAGHIQRLRHATMVSCWLQLSALDISRLDFRKPVYIKEFNQFFYINTITDYIPGSPEPVQVELLFFKI